jgi:hypothetical protein
MPDGSGRFPAPWRAEKVPGGYVVRDAAGQAFVYLYSRDNEPRLRVAHLSGASIAFVDSRIGKSLFAARQSCSDCTSLHHQGYDR